MQSRFLAPLRHRSDLKPSSVFYIPFETIFSDAPSNCSGRFFQIFLAPSDCRVHLFLSPGYSGDPFIAGQY